MSPAIPLQNVHSNSSEEQSDSQSRAPQPPSTRQGYSTSLTTAVGVEQGSLKEIREESSTTASPEALDHQEYHIPPWVHAPKAATMFQGAHGLYISGRPRFVNNFTVNDLGGSQGFGNFEQFVSFEALHDSSVQDFDRYVDQVIREKTLNQLQEWFDNPTVTEQIIWLHGHASIGKTAIALEIARQEKVVATFFFNRSDPSRNDGNRLFPTLAWQLAISIPDVKKHITHVLNERPDLPKKRIEEQFEYLVARPFAAMKKVTPAVRPSDLVVIIDGIDECVDILLQRRILKVIVKAILDRRVPLQFIVSSRDAQLQDICNQFHCPVRYIDLAKFGPAEEIRKRERKVRKREEELKDEERKLKERVEEITKKEEEARLKGDAANARELEVREILLRETEATQMEARCKGLAVKYMEGEAGRLEEIRMKEEELNRREDKILHLAEEMRQKAEEIKRQEEGLMKRKEELEQRELESRREKEEAKRRQEEAQKLEEEAKRQEEEANRLEDEAKRREEEARRKEDEARLKTEEAKSKEEAAKKEEGTRRKEDEAKTKELEARRKEREAHKKEMEAKRKESDARRKEFEAKRLEEGAKRMEEEARKREEETEKREEVERREEEALHQEEEMRQKVEEIKRREEELKRREEELERREAESRLEDERQQHARLQEEDMRRQQEEEEERQRQKEEERRSQVEAKLREEAESIKRREAEFPKRREELTKKEQDRKKREAERRRKEEERRQRLDEERWLVDEERKRLDEEIRQREQDEAARHEADPKLEEERKRQERLEEERRRQERQEEERRRREVEDRRRQELEDVARHEEADPKLEDEEGKERRREQEEELMRQEEEHRREQEEELMRQEEERRYRQEEERRRREEERRRQTRQEWQWEKQRLANDPAHTILQDANERQREEAQKPKGEERKDTSFVSSSATASMSPLSSGRPSAGLQQQRIVNGSAWISTSGFPWKTSRVSSHSTSSTNSNSSPKPTTTYTAHEIWRPSATAEEETSSGRRTLTRR